MIRLNYLEFEIVVENEPVYSMGSADNSRSYEHCYRLDDDPFCPTSKHSISVLNPDGQAEVATCILLATGGASGIHERSAVVNGGALVAAVGPFLVALEMPSLRLIWKLRVDVATCFGVYHSVGNRCYISHSELEIARVTYAGTIDWTNGGADIFTNTVTVTEDYVEAIDWNDNKYVWDIRSGLPIR